MDKLYTDLYSVIINCLPIEDLAITYDLNSIVRKVTNNHILKNGLEQGVAIYHYDFMKKYGVTVEKLEQFKNIESDNILNTIVYAGNLKNIKYLCAQKHTFIDSTFHYASLNGNLKNMKWLRKHNCKVNASGKTFYNAALNGKLKNMKWLKKQGCSVRNALEGALINGNFKNIKWVYSISEQQYICTLHKYGFYNGIQSKLFECAALSFHKNALKNIKWLVKQSRSIGLHYANDVTELDYHAFNAAASRGNLDILKWLHQNKCLLASEAMGYATLCSKNPNKCLEIMKWLYKNGCTVQIKQTNNGPVSIDNGVINKAIQNGSMEVINFLLNIGYKFNDKSLEIAITWNQIHIAKLLLSQGYKLDGKILLTAFKSYVKYKNKEILNLVDIIYNTHKNIVDTYCNYKYRTVNICDQLYIIAFDSIDAMNYLFEKGIVPTSNDIFYSATERNKLFALEWLYLHKCPIIMINNLNTRVWSKYNRARTDLYDSTKLWLINHNLLYDKVECISNNGQENVYYYEDKKLEKWKYEQDNIQK
jgi:hypothetical protein